MALSTVLSFGTILIIVGLVAYRFLWAASSFAGAGMVPRRLQRFRRWIQGG